MGLGIYIKMAMIKKINGRFLLTRSRAGRGESHGNGIKNHIVPDDYEFNARIRGFGDYGYIHLGGKFIMFTPNQFIGKKVRLVLEEVE